MTAKYEKSPWKEAKVNIKTLLDIKTKEPKGKAYPQRGKKHD